MSSLMIRDLSRTRELDRHAMSAVSGGTGSSVPGLPSASGLSGIANVNVSINQNLTQMQYTLVVGRQLRYGVTIRSRRDTGISRLLQPHRRATSCTHFSYTDSATRPLHTEQNPRAATGPSHRPAARFLLWSRYGKAHH